MASSASAACDCPCIDAVCKAATQHSVICSPAFRNIDGNWQSSRQYEVESPARTVEIASTAMIVATSRNRAHACVKHADVQVWRMLQVVAKM